MGEEEHVSLVALAEERFKLEREAFEIERARLEAARERAERELKSARSGHPFLVFSSISLLVLLSFLGGMMFGEASNEDRHQRQREARLREALSQLGGIAGEVTTNSAPFSADRGKAADPRRNVSVVVFQ